MPPLIICKTTCNQSRAIHCWHNGGSGYLGSIRQVCCHCGVSRQVGAVSKDSLVQPSMLDRLGNLFVGSLVSPTNLYHNKGAAHEMLVCMDLLNKGMDVYRSVSAACPCDLVVSKANILYRVEVTSGIIRRRKRDNQNIIHHVKARGVWGVKFDVLAVVIDRGIYYSPPQFLEGCP